MARVVLPTPAMPLIAPMTTVPEVSPPGWSNSDSCDSSGSRPANAGRSAGSCAGGTSGAGPPADPGGGLAGPGVAAGPAGSQAAAAGKFLPEYLALRGAHLRAAVHPEFI